MTGSQGELSGGGQEGETGRKGNTPLAREEPSGGGGWELRESLGWPGSAPGWQVLVCVPVCMHWGVCHFVHVTAHLHACRRAGSLLKAQSSVLSW